MTIKTPMRWYQSPLFLDFAALFAGCLLPFAFAPFGIFPLAVIAPAILLITLLNCSVGRSSWRGFLFGLGCFGIGVYWVFISIHVFGNTPVILAGMLTALFIFALAAFTATQTFLFKKLSPQIGWRSLCLAFPASWVLLEWLRSWVLTGFPWLLLGASQTASPLKGFAPMIGEYGVSFLVALSSGFIVMAIRLAHKKWYLCLAGLLIIWLSGYALSLVSWTKPYQQPLRVSLIQGNIPQEIKWDPATVVPTVRLYYQLTQQHWDSQLIIWPEASIPLLKANAQEFLNKLNEQAQQRNTAVIVGIPVQEGFHYYNALLLLGNAQGIYYKRHLVPFGEYVPLENWLRGLLGFFNIPMSDFSKGAMQQSAFEIKNFAIAPFICYEIAYAQTVRNDAKRANLLVTISNDAWFGESYAAAQHLQIGQMRALETGRYALFATNNGITAIVSSKGKIMQQLPRFKIGVLTANVPLMQGITPFLWLGTVPVISLICALLLGIFFWERNRA